MNPSRTDFAGTPWLVRKLTVWGEEEDLRDSEPSWLKNCKVSYGDSSMFRDRLIVVQQVGSHVQLHRCHPAFRDLMKSVMKDGVFRTTHAGIMHTRVGDSYFLQDLATLLTTHIRLSDTEITEKPLQLQLRIPDTGEATRVVSDYIPQISGMEFDCTFTKPETEYPEKLGLYVWHAAYHDWEFRDEQFRYAAWLLTGKEVKAAHEVTGNGHGHIEIEYERKEES